MPITTLWRLIFAIERHNCVCCTQWPWPKLSRSNSSSIGWKIETLALPSDRKSSIRHRMVPLRMLYMRTLIYICKVTNFDVWISPKRRELTKNVNYDFYRGWYLPSNCEWCTPWPWPPFLMLNLSLLCICHKNAQVADVHGRFASTSTARRAVTLLYFAKHEFT